jgi:SAM-dependent methyltransferase
LFRKIMTDLYDIKLDTFSQFLDEGLNYHYMESGELSNDFDNYTYNTLEHLKNCKSLLDVGCGYGGPCRLINKYLQDLNIECVTNEVGQYEYVSQFFKTYLSDSSKFSVDKRYDIITFFDSFCHTNGEKTLENLSKYTNRILIKDYTHLEEDEYYSSRWEMTFRSETNWKKILYNVGFDVKIFELNTKVKVKETHEFWREKLKSVESNERQIMFLREITSLNSLKPNKKHCIIYAEKK